MFWKVWHFQQNEVIASSPEWADQGDIKTAKVAQRMQK